MSERCTGTGQPAKAIVKSTQPRWFGQRFGVCSVCGGPVRIKVNTVLATAHNKRSDR